MNKLYVIKVGGKVVEDPKRLKALLNEFKQVSGYKILVHGGGSSATRIGERMGIESKYVDGRRITDSATIDLVTMVYGGLVNKKIVAGLQALNCNALGLTGADLNVIESVKRPVKDVDYGLVGDVRGVNTEILIDLINQGVSPVFSPITHDGRGNLLNTNADTIAAEVAISLARHFQVQLIYCFEKKGVLSDVNNDDSVIRTLNLELYLEYKSLGIIHDGMIPKLDNAFRCIKSGVSEVMITKAENFINYEGTLISS